MDYIEIFNMSRPDLIKWIRSRKWRHYRRQKDSLDDPYRPHTKRFTDEEEEEAWKVVEQFKGIVLKWINDTSLSWEERKHVTAVLRDVRRMGLRPPGWWVFAYHTHFPYVSWVSEKLEGLVVEERRSGNFWDFFEFDLYQDLYEDVQAVMKGERLKPLQCALVSETDRQRNCGRLFRLKARGRPRKFCSERCKSTYTSRQNTKEKARERLQNVPEGI